MMVCVRKSKDYRLVTRCVKKKTLASCDCTCTFVKSCIERVEVVTTNLTLCLCEKLWLGGKKTQRLNE